jgi:hypothetical protein
MSFNIRFFFTNLLIPLISKEPFIVFKTPFNIGFSFTNLLTLLTFKTPSSIGFSFINLLILLTFKEPFIFISPPAGSLTFK